MQATGFLVALLPAFIWSLSPIYYRTFMGRFDFLNLNLLRTATSSAALAIPALYLMSFGVPQGFSYALLSGGITLALGDSFYLLSIREVGASIAAPTVYTYVLLVQVAANLVGVMVTPANFVAAGMVILGVFVLSRGVEGKPRAKGIAFAIGAAFAWTVGQLLVQVTLNAGVSVLVVTFGRDLAGAAVLALLLGATGRSRKWPSGITRKELGIVTLVAVSDLALGSLFFVYAISLIQIALTVIMTSLSPLLTQVFSRALGKETPSYRDYVGGVLIVAALVLAIAFSR